MNSHEQKLEYVEAKLLSPVPPAMAKLLIAAQDAYQRLVIIMEQERSKPPPRLDKS